MEKIRRMQDHRIRLGEGGRLIIPAAYRKMMGVCPGDELVIRIQDGELRLFQQAEALKRIRAAVKRGSGKARHTDNFLAFRRKDSAE